MSKVLLVNESSIFKSGLGKYGYHLLSGLKNKGYQVAELAFGRTIEADDDSAEWPVYYNNVSQHDKRYEQMMSDEEAKFGKWRFEKTCLDFRPDYVLSISDPWHCHFLCTSPLRRYYNYVAMPTADTFPIKSKHYSNYTNPDVLLTYSEWAKELLSKYIREPFACARYGVDPSTFFRMKNKRLVKQNMGIDPNMKIIGTVCKNQPRKLIAELIFAFADLAKKRDDVMLYIHTEYPSKMGWDLPFLLAEAGVSDKVLFTYTCTNCQQFYPSKYIGQFNTCKACKNKSLTIKSPSFKITEENLNVIFNMFDVYVQYTCSEGAGMPVAEAAYCGLPTVVVDTTAMKDYGNTLGSYKVPAKHIMAYNEHGFRGWPDHLEFIKIVERILSDPEEIRATHSQKIIEAAHQNYNWASVVDIWDAAIKSVQPKNKWGDPKVEIQQITIKDENIDSFAILSILQDYLGIDDPYSNISIARSFEDAQGIKYNPYIENRNLQHMINGLNKYINLFNTLESVRVGETQFEYEDFIDYARIKGIVNEQTY